MENQNLVHIVKLMNGFMIETERDVGSKHVQDVRLLWSKRVEQYDARLVGQAIKNVLDAPKKAYGKKGIEEIKEEILKIENGAVEQESKLIFNYIAEGCLNLDIFKGDDRQSGSYRYEVMRHKNMGIDFETLSYVINRLKRESLVANDEKYFEKNFNSIQSEINEILIRCKEEAKTIEYKRKVI